MSLNETTLADTGYTSIALGKWHLGELGKFQPQSRGFDEFFGFLAGMHDYFKDTDKNWGPVMDGRQPGKPPDGLDLLPLVEGRQVPGGTRCWPLSSAASKQSAWETGSG